MKTPKCPKCQGGMEAGYIEDAKGATLRVSQWATIENKEDMVVLGVPLMIEPVKRF